MCGFVEDGILPGFFGYEAGPVVRRRPLRLVRRELRPGGLRARGAGPRARHPPAPRREGRPARALGESGPARARLVERQPLGPRGRRPHRPAARRDAGDEARGDLPRAHRGDRLRHAGHRRDVRGARRPDPRARRLRRPGREEPAADADLRRRHRAPVQARARRTRRRPWARRCSARWPPAPRPAGTPRSPTRRGRWPASRTAPSSRSPANRAVYDVLFREYVRLHDYFGRGENDVMKVLKGLRTQARAGGAATTGA